MSTKHQRRRRADQAHCDVADDLSNASTPTDADALASLRVLIEYLTGQIPGSKIFTQHDLPPDCRSRDAFMRRHRELRKAGIDGARVVGKTLACSPAAWAHELPKKPRLAVVPALEPGDSIDAELGIRPRRRP